MEYLIRLTQREYITLLLELNERISMDKKFLKDPTATPNEKDIYQHHLDDLRPIQTKVQDAEVCISEAENL